MAKDEAPQRPIAELFAVLVDWVLATGQEKVNLLPGLWHGETDDWAVRLNGHTEQCEDVSPMTFELRHKTAMLGLAIVSPFDGIIIGPDEQELIEYFRSAAASLRSH